VSLSCKMIANEQNTTVYSYFRRFLKMVHALFWPMPENKADLTANDYAKHKLDTLKKATDGPLTVSVSGSPEFESDISMVWELEGEENGMVFTLDYHEMTAAILNDMDFDRFQMQQNVFEEVQKIPDLEGWKRRFLRVDPIEEAERHIYQLEQLQRVSQKLIDDLEAEKARTQKFLKDKEAEKARSDIWPPFIVAQPGDVS
jgi:hypothetical protein